MNSDPMNWCLIRIRLAIFFLLGVMAAGPAMGAIAFETATEAFGQINGSVRTITIPIPGGTAAGDVLIASMSVRWYQATVTPPTGWNVASQLIEDTPQSNGAGTCNSGTTAGIRTLTFYRVATGTEAAPVFTYSSSCNDSGFGAAGMLRFSGVDTTNPIVASAESTTGNSTSHTAPSVNSGTETDTMLVTVHSYGSSRSWTGTPPGMAERVDQRSYDSNNALGATLGVFTQSITAAGATGTRTATGAGDSDNGATQSILLRPASASAALAVADYRFDETTWDGTLGEVTDSIGQNHPGTAVNGTTTTDPGLVCRAGTFDGSNHIDVPDLSDLLSGTASLAFWINTTQVGNNTNWLAPGVTGVEQSGGTNDIFWGWLDGAGRIGISVGNDTASKSAAAVNDGTWHHVVLTRNHVSGAYKIYIDGSLNASGSSTASANAGIITTPFSSIGRIEDTGGSPEHFQGELDEVMVFDAVLSDAQVLAGYTNQLAGDNWDGSERTCQSGGGGPCGITVGNFTANSVNTSDTLTLQVPADAAVGDVLIAQVAVRNTGTINAHSDWTLIRNDNVRECSGIVVLGICILGTWSDVIAQSAFYRVIDGTEPASYSWTFPGNRRAAGGVTTFSGVDPDAPIDAHNGEGGSGNTISAPSVTTTSDGGHLLALFASANGNTNVSLTAPLATIYQERTAAGGNGAAIAAGHEALGSAGLTGSREATAGNNDHVGQLVALRAAPCAPSGPDHIRLLHDGTGLTCQAEPITVRACTDSDCSSLYTGAVTVDLTAPTAGWTPDPVTFSGGEAVVQLSRTTAGTVTLNAEATSPAAANPTQCVNSGGGNACELSFADVGVLIDGDGSDGTLASNIAVQIAGKPSNIGFNAATQRVRVVRTDTQTGACIPGVESQTLNASFSYLVPTASEGLADNTIIVNGASSANLTAAAAGQTVQLAFDGNGTAPFSFTSQDAGRYQVRVAMGIPVTDGDGAPTGETIAASDTSNTFVARPLAVFADAAGNPKAQDATGSAYLKAGAAFSMTFQSLRWVAGRDDDGDGRWDGCGSSNLAAPGTYARVPAWTIGQPAADLALPAGGTNAGLNYADGNAGFTAGASAATAANVSYGEVGIVQLRADGMSAFFGEAVEACSPYIGRFYPDHFDVSHTATPACNATFTYAGLTGSKAGQPFGVSGTVTARNAGGGITTNYEGSFAKLGTGNIAASPRVGAAAAAGTLTWSVDALGFDEGVGSFGVLAAQYAFSAEGAPQNMHLRITATDSDGVTGTDDVITNAVPYRLGRLRLQNAFGPELMDLDVPLQAESFTTGGFYARDADDGCTALTLAGHLQFSSDNGATWSSGDNPVAVGGTTTTADPLFSPLVGGDAGLSFNTPGSGNTGSIDILTTIGASHPWLLFDWDGNGVHNNEATGRATFGIYKGSPRHIYLRERY